MYQTVSVIIPAHNEERYLARCIQSIKKAARQYPGKTEIIVVCNRCTDKTAQIAEKCGARAIRNEDTCIAKVRNAGIAAASGEIIVTIDADNRMTAGTIREAAAKLRSKKYIGGGAPIRFERLSAPLLLQELLCAAGFRITGLYCGIFWAEKKSFQRIGGFADKRAMEDIATAKALKKLGKQQAKQYGCLKQNHLINSTRKWDEMGDWLYFRMLIQNAGAFLRFAAGDHSAVDHLIDKMFYQYNDR
ncbi:MAG TPA: glycosyl transferase family 2 [Ruminococcus sp.]|nr:glycosyl transferase family 2 [Ruminococcus sp.]